jgi:SAM-dependent methyltransferase
VQEQIVGDAFGQLVLDCLGAGLVPGAAYEIIERDDGFIQAGDPLRYFAQPDRWHELDHWACDRVHGRTLDIGAGAGRHALYLQERGQAVVALDSSPGAAEVCRLRGVNQVILGTVETVSESFDTFLLLGNNLGLLRDTAYAPRLLRTLAGIANRGAVVIGNCLDPHQTTDPAHLEYHTANRASGRMGGQARLRTRYRRVATEWFDYLFLSLDELESLVSGTQWKLVEHEARGATYAVRLQLS